MDKKSESKPESGQAAELLGSWRAAERDTAAAKTAVEIASLALAAAHAAEEAAVETEAAAKSAAGCRLLSPRSGSFLRSS